MKNTYTAKEIADVSKAYIGVHSHVRKSEDEIAEIVKEYLINGRTVADLKAQYGTSVITLITFVRAQVGKQGNNGGRSKSKMTDEQVMLMYKDYSAGEKYKDLTKKYQLGSNAIAGAFRERGLPMKRDASTEAILANARARQADRLLSMEGIENPAIQIANTATKQTFAQRKYKVRILKKRMKEHARVSHKAMPKNIWWVG